MKNILLTITLLISLLSALSKPVFAHDPGMSFANVQVLKNKIILQISFALTDMETIVIIDSNYDNQFSQSELHKAYTQLTNLFEKAIEARIENRLIGADSIEFSIELNESLIVSLAYEKMKTGQFSLYMPVLKQLPRGHRQYLLINNYNGTYQNVLSASSAPVIFDFKADNSVNTIKLYFTQGIYHIFSGFDHILFLLTLLLPAVLVINNNQYRCVENLMPGLIDTVKIVTAFTLAHSITLGLAVFQVVQLSGHFVEAVIAFSIIVCAANNLKPILPASRWSLAFGFGFIHGFGFANALISLGLESKNSIVPLLGFNLGIETGQLVIVLIVLPVIYMIRDTMVFRIGIFKGGSIASILIASTWMIERTV